MKIFLAPHNITIYGLVDQSGEVRYVGRTSKTPAERLTRHIWKAREKNESSNLYVSRWIRSVGYDVTVRVLELNPVDSREAERRWVEYFREAGARLTNMTHGGEGAPPQGFLLSPEQRAKISASNRRRWAKPGEREKLAERNRQGTSGMKGRHHTLMTRERIGDAHRGIPKGSPSTETRRRMSEAAKRKVISAETRHKLSVAKKGHTLSDKSKAKLSESQKAAWARRKGVVPS